jgi:predicted amidohydrolase
VKICAIQTRPQPEDLAGNIKKHQDWIIASTEQGADLILFPELSLTGYEPTRAQQLAIKLNDERLDPFQALSDKHHVNIAVGAPLQGPESIHIALIIFSPTQPRRSYSKGHLHPDEEPFFLPGRDQPVMTLSAHQIALSICFEISVPEHLAQVMQHGPHAYLASVAKFRSGIDGAMERLSTIARIHSLPVIMANSVGPADGGICAGRTTAWNAHGEIIGQLDKVEERGLLLDLKSCKASPITL